MQNHVSIYTGTVIEDDVFLGPSCVLIKVSNPRSQVLRHALCEKTLLRFGVTIGANATDIFGVTSGRYAFMSAGAVVPKDLAGCAYVQGVRTRQVGRMSRHGHPLRKKDQDGNYVCPESGFRYRENELGVVRCLDLNEDALLPRDLSVGSKGYREIKQSNESP